MIEPSLTVGLVPRIARRLKISIVRRLAVYDEPSSNDLMTRG
jgi:hypothetical protein